MRNEARLVGAEYVKALVEKAELSDRHVAAESWSRAQHVYTYLQAPALAIECGERAVALAPNDFSKRRSLATLLVRNQRYEQAARHLQWCLRRKPDDSALAQLAADAKRQSLSPSVSPTARLPERETRR
jgi:tetratricopeptide (TPR) repeat protein